MTSLIRHDLSDPAIPEGMVRIVLGSRYRFIWPVHLGGWQSLGWQLQSTGIEQMPEPRLPELLTEAEPEQDLPAAGSELQSAPPGADLQSAPLGATFQAMTKAQIIEYCSTVYGVELDGSQTKTELIQQAAALEDQGGSATEPQEGQEAMSCEPLPDALVDDPLI
jgi:hypothetical protein